MVCAKYTGDKTVSCLLSNQPQLQITVAFVSYVALLQVTGKSIHYSDA
jgi:hypothetical protein